MQTLMIGDIIVKEPPSEVVVNEKDEENFNPEFIEWEEKDVLVRS